MRHEILAGSKRIIVLSAAATIAAACGGKSEKPVVDTTAPAAAASTTPATSPASSPDAPSMVRGTVASVNATDLVVKSDSATTTVHLTQPVTVYARSAGTLADVKDNTFIGVTTVKQADGSERATEIHIFPEDLRGLGEGSRMMANGTAPAGSRMTNGAVAGGTSGGSRMTNGAVSGSPGSTMVVNYAGGSQTVTVPAGVTITELKAVSRPVAVGDQVVAMTTKAADGSLSTNKVLISSK